MTEGYVIDIAELLAGTSEDQTLATRKKIGEALAGFSNGASLAILAMVLADISEGDMELVGAMSMTLTGVFATFAQQRSEMNIPENSSLN